MTRNSENNTNPESSRNEEVKKNFEFNTLFDREKSDDVREECGIQKINEWIRRRKEECRKSVR